MKHVVCLALALLLAASLFCSAAAENVFTTKYFTMTLPDGWEIDTEDLESGQDAEALGFFGSSEEIGLVAGAYLVYYEDLKDFALWNAGEEELQAYAETVIEDFGDDSSEWIGTVMAGSIPFILIKGEDADGEYLYADTITNGYSIQFEVYVTDMEGEKYYPVTDSYIDQFKDILATFRPVS